MGMQRWGTGPRLGCSMGRLLGRTSNLASGRRPGSHRLGRAAVAIALVAAAGGCTPAQVRSFMDRHGIEHPPNVEVKRIAAALTQAKSKPTTRAKATSASKATSSRPATGFDSWTSKVSTARLGNSWRKGCPVGASSLRLVSVDYWGFDGKVHDGEIIVNKAIVSETVAAFKKLYEGRFPIEQMVTADRYIKRSQVRASGVIAPSSDKSSVNNTVGFVCRKVTGGSSWSEHAYGTAIDINPVQNPYVSDGTVLPTNGQPKRTKAPGKLIGGGWAVEAFTDQGFAWGGRFGSLKDYMHFEFG